MSDSNKKNIDAYEKIKQTVHAAEKFRQDPYKDANTISVGYGINLAHHLPILIEIWNKNSKDNAPKVLPESGEQLSKKDGKNVYSNGQIEKIFPRGVKIEKDILEELGDRVYAEKYKAVKKKYDLLTGENNWEKLPDNYKAVLVNLNYQAEFYPNLSKAMSKGEPVDALLKEIAVHLGNDVMKKRTAQNVYLLVTPLDKFDSQHYDKIGDDAQKNNGKIPKGSEESKQFIQGIRKKAEQHQALQDSPKVDEEKQSTKPQQESFIADDMGGHNENMDQPIEESDADFPTHPDNETVEHKQQQQASIEKSIDSILETQGIDKNARYLLTEMAQKIYASLFKQKNISNTENTERTKHPPQNEKIKNLDGTNTDTGTLQMKDVISDTANENISKDNPLQDIATKLFKTPVSKMDDTIEHVINKTADDEMVKNNLMLPSDYANTRSPNNQMLITMAQKYFADAYQHKPVTYDVTGKMLPIAPYKPKPKPKATLDNIPLEYGLSGLGLGLAGAAQKYGHKKAVQTVQKNLNAQRKPYEPTLKEDGEWGPKTNAQARRSIMRNTLEDSMQLVLREREAKGELINHKGTKKSNRWAEWI